MLSENSVLLLLKGFLHEQRILMKREQLVPSTFFGSIHYHPRMQVGNVFGRVCLSICMSICSHYNF